VRVEERAFSVRARIRAVAGAPLQVSDVTTDGVGGESACACIHAVLASMRIDDPSPPGPLAELALSWPVQARYRGELELGPRYLGKGPIPE
jgi:hypothetical protein